MDTIPVIPRNEVYATFCSGIDQSSVQRIMQSVAHGMQNNVTHLHLLFKSNGGEVPDDLCLSTSFKTCPLPITLYNAGAVQSIGAIAYLGAKNRIAHKNSVFMIHRTTGPAIAVGTNRMQSITKAISLDDLRTEEILKQYSEKASSEWANLRDNEFWLNGEDAVKHGLATELGEFAPPLGTRIYNI